VGIWDLFDDSREEGHFRRFMHRATVEAPDAFTDEDNIVLDRLCSISLTTRTIDLATRECFKSWLLRIRQVETSLSSVLHIV
jgi:hypothetical protein